MSTTTITTVKKSRSKNLSNEQDIVHFYENASMDYRFWSKDLNMHFGYFIFGKTNPLRRDSMLNEMNDQVYSRLKLNHGIMRVADLGCGMGGTMKHFLKKNRKLFMFGVTISPLQVKKGNKNLKDLNGIICQESYKDTTLQSNSMDGAVAIESFCHAGHDKESLREAYRILKPGANFVMADCFLKKGKETLCFGSNLCYEELCKCWNLEGLGAIEDVKKRLEDVGFKKVEIKDISWRVAPSVFHVPFAIVGFLLKKLFRSKSLKNQSKNNLRASFYALLAGLHRSAFGYYIITATK